MSKTETIEALMDSAIQSFSRYGYEGASLRDIARNADVPLSTIHLYFGSKHELFDAVRQQAWDDLDGERSALFETAVAELAPGDALLEGIIHALAYPVARRALSDNPRDTAHVFLLRAHWNRMPDAEMIQIADRSLLRWLDALLACCPAFNRADVGWAISFTVGAIYSWQLLDRRYTRLVGPEIERTSDEVTRDLVTFCCAGIKTMHTRRAQERSAGAVNR